MLTIVASTGDGRAQTPANGPSPAITTDVSAANINITPRRVIFSGSKRAEAVYVFNRGLVPVTVDVKLADNFMTTSGQIVPLTAANPVDSKSLATSARLKSAGQLLLATPSRISLAPGSVKVVRIRALQPPEGAGEWRSHLTFTAIPPADSGITAERANNPGAGEFAFKVRAIFGLSIPLIVRGSGEPGHAAIIGLGIEPLGLSDNNPTLKFELQRSGDQSVFGDIEVSVSQGRKRETVGFLRGISVYPEIDSRSIRIPLTRRPRSGEKLEVTYTADAEGKRGVLASASLVAP